MAGESNTKLVKAQDEKDHYLNHLMEPGEDSFPVKQTEDNKKVVEKVITLPTKAEPN
jgi:hypothetical protein